MRTIRENAVFGYALDAALTPQTGPLKLGHFDAKRYHACALAPGATWSGVDQPNAPAAGQKDGQA